MEFTLIGTAIVAIVIAVVGWALIITAALTLWYGKWYWSGVEKNYTQSALQTSWRYNPRTGHLPWFWRIVRKLAKHNYDRTQLDSLPAGPVIFSCQPHGIFALSAVLTFLSGLADRPGQRVVVAIHGWYWWVPGLRQLMLALGCIDCRWVSMENAICNGYSVAIMPGAILEMGPPLIPLPDVFPLLKRVYAFKGHVDIPIVPVFFKGEDEICWLWHNEPKLIKWMRRKSYEWIGMYVPLVSCPRVWKWPVLNPVHRAYLGASKFKTVEAMQKALEDVLEKYKEID
jgi:hypothetical protein